MSKTTSIIEINGNRYDAVTGQLIGAAKKAAQIVAKPITGLTIDGFSKPAKITRRSAVKRSVHTIHRKTERSKTLMRTSVKKPARAKSEEKFANHSLSPDHARAGRAAIVSRHPRVNRFGVLPFAKRTEAKTGEILPAKNSSPSQRSATNRPVRGSAAVTAGLPAVISSSHNRLERLLDLALAQADAHKRLRESSKRDRRKLFGVVPRWLAIGLAILIAAVALGFFAWKKMPQASLKLAATKANVDASLPSPISGYKIGPITASKNAVVTTVQSTTDSSKKYIVTEKPSNQPTASLAANTTAAKNTAQVQTVQDQDKTYVLAQEDEKSTAACTKGSNTIEVESVSLDVAELLEAAKNACN